MKLNKNKICKIVGSFGLSCQIAHFCRISPTYSKNFIGQYWNQAQTFIYLCAVYTITQNYWNLNKSFLISQKSKLLLISFMRFN